MKATAEKCGYCYPQGDKYKTILGGNVNQAGNPYSQPIFIYIKDDELTVRVDLEELEVEINYCPMCGRELGE